MKFLKKFALLLLCLSLMFAMVACGDDSEDEDYEDEGGEHLDDSGLADYADYLASSFDKILSANSVTITADLQGSASEGGERFSAEGDFTSTIAKTNKGVDASFDFEAIISEGDYSGSVWAEGALIDGVVFVEAKNIDGEVIEEEIDLEDVGADDYIEQYLTALESFFDFEALGLTEEIVDQFVASVAQMFAPIVDKSGKDYVIEDDLADDIEDMVDFIYGLDELTVEELINEMLAAIAADFTVDDLLDEIEDNKDMTVGEIYEDLDAAYEQGTGYTIQEMYELIMDSELVEKYFEALGDIYGFDTDYLDQFKDIEIESYIEPYEDYTIDQLAIMATGGMGASTMIGYIKDTVLDMKIGDLIRDSVGEYEYEYFLDIIGSIDVNALSFKYTMKANANNEYTGVKLYVNVDIEFSDGYDDMSIKGSFNYDMSISDENVKIEKP